MLVGYERSKWKVQSLCGIRTAFFSSTVIGRSDCSSPQHRRTKICLDLSVVVQCSTLLLDLVGLLLAVSLFSWSTFFWEARGVFRGKMVK